MDRDWFIVGNGLAAGGTDASLPLGPGQSLHRRPVSVPVAAGPCCHDPAEESIVLGPSAPLVWSRHQELACMVSMPVVGNIAVGTSSGLV